MVFAIIILAMNFLIYSILDTISSDKKCILQLPPIGLPLEIFGGDVMNTTQVSPWVWMDLYH